MKARTFKTLDRMLTRALPLFTDGSGWPTRFNAILYETPQARTALRRARALVTDPQ